MTDRDRFRELAANDVHARELAEASDGWFSRSGLTIKSTPGAAIAMAVEECPVDPRARAKIAYWTVDLAHPRLRRALTVTTRHALDYAEAHNTKVWGFGSGADHGQHLYSFIQRIVDAGACKKIVTSPPEEGQPDFSRGMFYVASVGPAREFLRG